RTRPLTPSSHLATPAPTPAGPTRVSGDCWILLAFDVGHEVLLDRAHDRFEGATRPGFRHRMGTGAEELGRCLRAVVRDAPVELGAHATAPEVDVAVYAAGAIALAWRLPVDLPAAEA